MSRKPGRTIEGYEKDQKALELRKEGHSYESISEQLGYSTRGASYKAVMRRLRDMDRHTLVESGHTGLHRYP